jgi:hypothetical protein
LTGRLKVAVTGGRGRLGCGLLERLPAALAWSRPDYDLDDPAAAERLMERDRPDLVIHAAAWTDVDGCARDPELARRRNARAVEELALACRQRGAGLVVVSTNEVFDGDRTDERGYSEADATNPPNPYGASKLEGEQAATAGSSLMFYTRLGLLPAMCIVGITLVCLRFCSGVEAGIESMRLDPALEREASNISPSSLHAGRSTAVLTRTMQSEAEPPSTASARTVSPGQSPQRLI